MYPLPTALFSDFRKTDPFSVKIDVEGKLKWLNDKVRCLLVIILITSQFWIVIVVT